MSRKIKGVPLPKELIKINTTLLLNKSKENSLLYQERMKSLQDILECRSPPKGKILIVSSCIPTSNLIPSAIRTHKRGLPILQGLNLLTIDDNGEYAVRQFDAYGTQEAANEFLKTLDLLITKKKFFVVISNNTIGNTYPGYKEKLGALGFKVLPKLNFRVAYIGYQNENGTIHEFSDKDAICKIIPGFTK